MCQLSEVNKDELIHVTFQYTFITSISWFLINPVAPTAVALSSQLMWDDKFLHSYSKGCHGYVTQTWIPHNHDNTPLKLLIGKTSLESDTPELQFMTPWMMSEIIVLVSKCLRLILTGLELLFRTSPSQVEPQSQILLRVSKGCVRPKNLGNPYDVSRLQVTQSNVCTFFYGQQVIVNINTTRKSE